MKKRSMLNASFVVSTSILERIGEKGVFEEIEQMLKKKNGRLSR